MCLTLCSQSLLRVEAQSLARLQQAAVEHNRSLQSARLSVQMAAEERREAFTHYFPTIQAMGGVFKGFDYLLRADIDMPELAMMGMPPMSINEIKKGALATISAVQPVFMGGQIVNGNRLAKLQEEVRRLQLRMSERDVRLQVARLYWQIVALQSNVGTLDAADRQLAEVHAMVENYVKAGLTQRNDLLRVELQQQELASSRLQLTNGIELSRMALAQLCGQTETANPELDSLIQNIGQQADQELASQPEPSTLGGVEGRTEALLAQKSVDAAAMQVKMERGKLLPKAGIGISDMYYNMMARNVNNGIVFATLAVPLTDWWGGTHAVRKARLAHQQAENDRQDALEKLRLDNRMAWNNLKESASQILLAQSSIETASDNLHNSLQQYKAGTLTLADLLDAETLHRRATDRLIEAQANYQLRLAEYKSKME